MVYWIAEFRSHLQGFEGKVIVASRIQSSTCISANFQPPTSETTACRLDSFVARCLAPASLSNLANSSKLVKVMAAAGTVLNMLVAQPL